MSDRALDIVFLGLSLSSSWGNGHATTFRSLLRGLSKLGHRIIFLERDVSWYASNRDLEKPDFCDLRYYGSIFELGSEHAKTLRSADVVVMGSYVPEGRAAVDAVLPLCMGAFCFYDIDTPVTLTGLARDECDYLSLRQVPAFDIYFSFTGGPILRQLEREFGAQRAVALYCSADTSLYGPTGETACWDLGYLGTYSADRQPMLDELLIKVARRMPERSFVVAGSQYPADLNWPANVERIAHLPPAGHASFYSRQRYTLNVTRRDMVTAGWSPSVRLFEAGACGTPIITDRWEGLEDFFPPGDAIHVADHTGDVCDILRNSSNSRRDMMALRARSIVTASHTGTARARDFLEGLAPFLGRRAA